MNNVERIIGHFEGESFQSIICTDITAILAYMCFTDVCDLCAFDIYNKYYLLTYLLTGMLTTKRRTNKRKHAAQNKQYFAKELQEKHTRKTK